MYKSQVEILKQIYKAIKNKKPIPYGYVMDGWTKKLSKNMWIEEVSSLDSWSPRSIVKLEDYHVFDPAGNDLTAEMYIVAEDIEMALKFINPKYHKVIESTAHLIELKRKALETMLELQLALVHESKKKR